MPMYKIIYIFFLSPLGQCYLPGNGLFVGIREERSWSSYMSPRYLLLFGTLTTGYYDCLLYSLICELFEGSDYILINIVSTEHRSMPDTMMWTSLLFAHWINEWVVYNHKHLCATAKMCMCTRACMCACVWDFVFGLDLDSSMFYVIVLIHPNKFYCEN